MDSEKKYLTKEILTNSIHDFNITVDDLISSDNYDETKLLAKYNKLSKDDQILMCKAALQLAVIGYGQKNYGSIRIDDQTTMPLVDLFKKLKIKYNENISAKYEDDEFSVRRLFRFFRYQIQSFIMKCGRPSYLWIKYSDGDRKYMTTCFPGAEHFLEGDEAIYLLLTYNKLDQTMKTRFVDRIKRVYIARRLFTFDELEKIVPKHI